MFPLPSGQRSFPATPLKRPRLLSAPPVAAHNTVLFKGNAAQGVDPPIPRFRLVAEEAVGFAMIQDAAQDKAGEAFPAKITSEYIGSGGETLCVYDARAGAEKLIGIAKVLGSWKRDYPGHGDKPYLYLTTLGTNHWHYKGIGTALILAAFQRSLDYGFEGRLALNAVLESRYIFTHAGIKLPVTGSRILDSPVPFYDAQGFRFFPAILTKPLQQQIRTLKSSGQFNHPHYTSYPMYLPPEEIAALKTQLAQRARLKIPAKAKGFDARNHPVA